jgi:hypothetical protein
MDVENELWRARQDQVAAPFRFFVDPQAYGSSTGCFDLSHLLEGPPEILGMVFEQCDAATLFQLLRSCRLFRSMTSKLFWSNPDVWYRVPTGTGWFMSRQFHRPQSCFLDMEFASRVMQIEINVGNLRMVFGYSRDPNANGPYIPHKDHVDIFWKAVPETFPSARNVILTTYWLRRTILPPDEQFNEEYAAVDYLLQKAPNGIHAVVSCFRRFGGALPEYWTFDISKSPRLQLTRTWPIKRVSPPSRKLPDGTLRDYEFMCKSLGFLESEIKGLRLLREETVGRYPGDAGIECPGCAAIFTGRDALDHHMWSDGCDCRTAIRSHIAENTPSYVKNALDAKEARISLLRADYETSWLKLRHAMGDPDSECRKHFSSTFEKLAEELHPAMDQETNSALTDYMRREFWSYFDPNHDRYRPAIEDFDRKIIFHSSRFDT